MKLRLFNFSYLFIWLPGFKRLSNFGQKILSLVLTFSILFSGSGMIYLFGPWSHNQVEAAWFDDNWLYRTPVSITNGSGGVLTDYQASFTLDTATLITANKLQSSCQDIR